MAWAGIIIGMFAGMLAAVAGYWIADLSLWMSLLMYPLVGSTVTLVVIAVLLRSADSGSGPRPMSGRGAPAPA
jgi:fructose-specific phosphotransferase system IIC component